MWSGKNTYYDSIEKQKHFPIKYGFSEDSDAM